MPTPSDPVDREDDALLATSRGERRSSRVLRSRRAGVADRLAAQHGGVMHRNDLRARGITYNDVRTEVAAGRWGAWGRHTVSFGVKEPTGIGRMWWAVWESGSGAVLNGPSALIAHGMTGFTEQSIQVSVPRSSRLRMQPGVTTHRHRVMDPTMGAGIPRARAEWATIRAAQWAVSDRQAALLVCLPVQQRLVPGDRLLAAWKSVGRSPRHQFLDAVIGDVCDGAHSLGELDFAGMCSHRGLPQPIRQSVRVLPSGRVYLDAEFEGGAVVEIDGGHHLLGLNPVDDALRANELTLGAARVLRIPVLGLRLAPDRFMDQVARLVGAESAGHALAAS